MVVDHLKGCFEFTVGPEDSLAVLRNKNRLVHAFSRSGWIQDTLGEVVSRSEKMCLALSNFVHLI